MADSKEDLAGATDHVIPGRLHQLSMSPTTRSRLRRPKWRHAFMIVVAFACLVVVLVRVLPALRARIGFFRRHWKECDRQITSQRVDSILARTPLIDGHNDFSVYLRYAYNNDIYGDNFTAPFERGGLGQHVDLPRLKLGKVGGTFWVAFTFCPKDSLDFSDENYRESVVNTLSLLDLLHRLRAAYPSFLSIPPNSSTALSFFRSGQLISPLAIEGLHQIGNSLSILRLYHTLGVRYASLTHNCHNIYADAALTGQDSQGSGAANPYWGGLSRAGRELVWEMNRMGMIVDLAHASHDTMRDVLGRRYKLQSNIAEEASTLWNGSLAPVINSHSNAYALCPHPRNVPDDILHMTKATNGLIMVSFVPDFVSCRASEGNGLPEFWPTNSTLARVVDHIIYIVDLIGPDHVGLGSDFDGIFETPRGMEDVSKYPDLVAEMLRRGMTDTDAEKIIGGNLLRVWSDVDAVARDMQARHQKPAQDRQPWLERPGEPQEGERMA